MGNNDNDYFHISRAAWVFVVLPFSDGVLFYNVATGNRQLLFFVFNVCIVYAISSYKCLVSLN